VARSESERREQGDDPEGEQGEDKEDSTSGNGQINKKTNKLT
jgi:hypothetical protein